MCVCSVRWARFRYPMLVTLQERPGAPSALARPLTAEDYPEAVRPKLREFGAVAKAEAAKLPEPVHDGKRMG